MNIKRFFAKNSREALVLVRRELGENAVILSNRAVNGGNEILAFREEEIDSLIHDDEPAETTASLSPSYLEALEREDSFVSFIKSNRNIMASVSEPAPAVTAPPVQIAPPVTTPPVVEAVEEKPLPSAVKTEPSISELNEKQMASMMSEIRTMRNAIESQLTEMSWNNIQKSDPVKSEMLGILLTAGFSPALSRQLAEAMPANLSQKEAMNWMQAIIDRNLNTMPDESELLDQGGIFSLVGPTGVGKTTTTAKLAARFVMKHGANKLGLITTDAYRIGGHEQLRIYGKILGVMVHAVKDEADLKIALEELKGKHTILIDTVGVSQRDKMVSEQIAMLSNADVRIKKLLCLNATNTSETLTDVINAYRGKGLDGCIMTKLDEAAIIGNILDVAIREHLKVYYVANGQRVPEDLHLANKKVLVHRALKLGTQRNSPFHVRNDELPFLMGTTKTTGKVALLAGADHA